MRGIFQVRENGSTIRTEVVGGLTTFMTMSYIIFVQPAVLAAAGMNFDAVMAATCIGSAVATFLMAFLANYPIALAPAMGHNFYFALNICLAMKVPWQIALGANFIAGAIFVVLTVGGLLERVVEAVPQSLKEAIAAGIGLLIAFIGLQWAGVIVPHSGTMVALGDLRTKPTLLALAGLLTIAFLSSRGIRGAILWGMLMTTGLAWMGGLLEYRGAVSFPPSLSPTLFRLDIAGALRSGMILVVFILFLLALFDTIGTLIGVAEQAGFLRNGTLPRTRRALLADSLGIVQGTLWGTSTVTCYVESAAGVAAGARTGLANVITGLLFLAALFFSPLARMMAGGLAGPQGILLYPVIAPPLIYVGSLMVKAVVQIPWNDVTEGIPAFLTLLIMPLALSITEGIAFGFIAYSLLKLLSGRIRESHWLVHAFSLLFLARYLFLGLPIPP